MKILEELEARYEESSVLKGFSMDEGVALVDLAYLVMLVDEDLSKGELEQFKKTVFGLTLTEGEGVEEVLTSGAVTPPMQVREKVGDAALMETFIRQRAAEFDSEDHKREALRVLATLSYSDGMEQKEEGVCHVIGRMFGLDDATIEDLLVDGAVDVWELGDS